MPIDDPWPAVANPNSRTYRAAYDAVSELIREATRETHEHAGELEALREIANSSVMLDAFDRQQRSTADLKHSVAARTRDVLVVANYKTNVDTLPIFPSQMVDVVAGAIAAIYNHRAALKAGTFRRKQTRETRSFDAARVAELITPNVIEEAKQFRKWERDISSEGLPGGTQMRVIRNSSVPDFNLN